MQTFLGPDGKPCVFEGDGYYSSDRAFKWVGANWVPVKQRRYMPRWLKALIWVGLGGIFAYAVYSSAASMSETQVYNTGFFFGIVALLVVVAVAIRYAGRLASGGTLVRGIVVGLFVLRVFLVFSRLHS